MPVLTCSSPTMLLDELHIVQSVADAGPWYFRGQADASWPLTPSLFRLGLRNEQQFERSMLEALLKYLATRSAVPDRLLLDGDHLLALAQPLPMSDAHAGLDGVTRGRSVLCSEWRSAGRSNSTDGRLRRGSYF